MRVINAGHDVGMNRIFAQTSCGRGYWEKISGATYYEFICNLEKSIEKSGKEVRSNLIKVYETIFNKNNLIISVVGEEKEVETVVTNINKVICNIKTEPTKLYNLEHKSKKNIEAIITASNVQYVVKGFNFADLGYEYSGKMRVLLNILDNEYLYPRVRLQSGAYGCYSDMNKDGNLAIYSYRDPNLTRTIDVYNEAYKFLEEVDFTKEDMGKFIIGSVGQLYKPLTPDRKGEKAVADYICNVTQEDIQRWRDELLSTSNEDIRNYASMIKVGMNENYCCIVGNEGKIKENKTIFNKTSKLL